MVSLLYLLFRRTLAVAALRLRSGEFKELKRAIIRVAVSGNSVVLVDETSELVAAADLPAGRSCLLLGLGRAELERTMRPLGVVVVDVDAQHPFEVASVQDQQPVETVGAHGADEAFGAIAFAFGARTGVFTIRIRRCGRPRRRSRCICGRGRGSGSGCLVWRNLSRGCAPARLPNRRWGWSCSRRAKRGGGHGRCRTARSSSAGRRSQP